MTKRKKQIWKWLHLTDTGAISFLLDATHLFIHSLCSEHCCLQHAPERCLPSEPTSKATFSNENFSVFSQNYLSILCTIVAFGASFSSLLLLLMNIFLYLSHWNESSLSKKAVSCASVYPSESCPQFQTWSAY